MTVHLVTGACGFVGRNMVRRLLHSTDAVIIMVDDLSIGMHPTEWIELAISDEWHGMQIFGAQERVFFLEMDVRVLFRTLKEDSRYFQDHLGLSFDRFTNVYHFAAIVGGRSVIENNPLYVAQDLAIDADFFYWITQHKPVRVLYPSSSAAYPVQLQEVDSAVALKEDDIDFNNLGQPDLTYGWSKLTGEYLARLAASSYNISICCIRPFSGYGEDQEDSYPIPAITQRVANRDREIEVWGSGNQGRDFVHIDDVIDCIEKAMEVVTDGSAINIGSGKLTTFNEIINMLLEIAEYDGVIKPLLDKPVGVHSRFADMSYVKEKLKWTPKISLKEGLSRMYQAAKNKSDV